MSVLAREDILAYIEGRKLKIKPFVPENVGPCSVDLRLSHKFQVDVTDNDPVIDLTSSTTARATHSILRKNGQPFILYPGELVRGMTLERVSIPTDLVGHLGGRSSLARAGVMVEIAPRIDPGFDAHITLELADHGKRPVKLIPGMRICAIEFTQLTRATEPYAGKYQHITSPEATRIGPELRREAQAQQRSKSRS